MKLDSSKHILITGGSRGIGKELTRGFISKGHNVYVVSRNKEDQKALSAELSSDKLFLFCGDLSSKNSIDAVYAEILKHAKHIDVLINNAGIDPVNRFTSLSWEGIEETINVNLRGHIYVTQLVTRGMIDSERQGHVVNISSLMGLIPIQYEVLYCATKFGLRGFSLALRSELKKNNIGVSVICPPPVRNVGMVAEQWGLENKPLLLDTINPSKILSCTLSAIEKNKRIVVPGLGLTTVGRIMYFISPKAYEYLVKVTGVEKYMESVIKKRSELST